MVVGAAMGKGAVGRATVVAVVVRVVVDRARVVAAVRVAAAARVRAVVVMVREAVVRVMAHHIGVLKDGRLVEKNTAEKLFRNPQETYTKTLIDATPKVMV